MENEKRRWERFQSNLFAVVWTEKKQDKIGRGVVIDANLHGFGLETESELTIGEVYEIDVEIPLTLKVKVVQRLAPGKMKRYGLMVKDQGLFDKFLLRKLLKGKKETVKFE